MVKIKKTFKKNSRRPLNFYLNLTPQKMGLVDSGDTYKDLKQEKLISVAGKGVDYKGLQDLNFFMHTRQICQSYLNIETLRGKPVLFH